MSFRKVFCEFRSSLTKKFNDIRRAVTAYTNVRKILTHSWVYYSSHFHTPPPWVVVYNTPTESMARVMT